MTKDQNLDLVTENMTMDHGRKWIAIHISPGFNLMKISNYDYPENWIR